MLHSIPLTWRDALGETIRNMEERVRIADAMGVSPETLRRWSTNLTNPHWKEIRALLRVLPDLAPLVVQDLLGTTDLVRSVPETRSVPKVAKLVCVNEEEALLPAHLYADVLQSAREMTGGRFLAVCRRIIPHALITLDSQLLGMEVALARCMPPEKCGKVHSLIQCLAQGNPPWEPHLLMESTLFLGAESFPGYVISRQHWMVTPNVTQHDHLLPLKLSSPHEVSVAVFPIMRGEYIAGCLIVSSTQTDFFSPIQLKLISQYADLLSLGFCDIDFYHPSRIELRTMPNRDVQREHLSTFRKRVAEVQGQNSAPGQGITTSEAEFMVRKLIERELLEICASDPVPLSEEG